jgi:hypothetical protein
MQIAMTEQAPGLPHLFNYQAIQFKKTVMKSGISEQGMVHWNSPIVVVITGDAPLDSLSTYLKGFLHFNIKYCD